MQQALQRLTCSICCASALAKWHCLAPAGFCSFVYAGTDCQPGPAVAVAEGVTELLISMFTLFVHSHAGGIWVQAWQWLWLCQTQRLILFVSYITASFLPKCFACRRSVWRGQRFCNGRS